jgi:hypothetical protein
MSSIIYSLSGDFSGNIREDQFHTEIAANASITTSFDGIIRNGDIITIKFFGNIDSHESNILQELVYSHTPNYQSVRRTKIPLPITNTEVTSNSWTRIAFGSFPGVDNIGDITYVDFLGYAENENPSYQVKLIDRSNAENVCFSTLTNNTLSSQTLGEILYQPQSQTDLECLAKLNGNVTSEKIHVQSLDIWYGS